MKTYLQPQGITHYDNGDGVWPIQTYYDYVISTFGPADTIEELAKLDARVPGDIYEESPGFVITFIKGN